MHTHSHTPPLQVSKPKEVADSEQVRASVSDDTIIRVVTAHSAALSKAVRAMRALLPTHGGYECKEPEPGKLSLAFRHALQRGRVRLRAARACERGDVGQREQMRAHPPAHAPTFLVLGTSCHAPLQAPGRRACLVLRCAARAAGPGVVGHRRAGRASWQPGGAQQLHACLAPVPC